MADIALAKAAGAVIAGREMAGSNNRSTSDGLRLALQERGNDTPSEERALSLMHLAIDVAEDLDALERKIDPHGPPPRHAAMAYQRLRRIKSPM